MRTLPLRFPGLGPDLPGDAASGPCSTSSPSVARTTVGPILADQRIPVDAHSVSGIRGLRDGDLGPRSRCSTAPRHTEPLLLKKKNLVNGVVRSLYGDNGRLRATAASHALLTLRDHAEHVEACDLARTGKHDSSARSSTIAGGSSEVG